MKNNELLKKTTALLTRTRVHELAVRHGLRWYRDQHCSLVNTRHRAGRVHFAKQVELMNMVTDYEWLKQTEWTDESQFVFELGSTGRYGNWFLSAKDANLHKFVHKTKHPSSVMVFASIRYNRKPIPRYKI